MKKVHRVLLVTISSMIVVSWLFYRNLFQVEMVVFNDTDCSIEGLIVQTANKSIWEGDISKRDKTSFYFFPGNAQTLELSGQLCEQRLISKNLAYVSLGATNKITLTISNLELQPKVTVIIDR